jgi:hypothetical protein
MLPLLSILDVIVQTLVARDTEHVAVLEFLGKGNDIVVKESKLSLVPESARVLHHSTSADSSVHLPEESLVPLAEDMPVLHGMRHIGCLNDVFNHNGSAEVIINFVGQIALRKCSIS